MKEMLRGLEVVMKSKGGVRIIIASSLFLLLLLLLSQNGKAAITVLSLNVIPLKQKIVLFLSTLFDITNTFTTSTLILAILGSLVTGINLALAYLYIKTRGEMILRSGLYTGVGLFLALLGIGCAACGTALLSIILSFFGFSAMLSLLPYEGQEIGHIGIIFLLFATYFLSKKLAAPNVC